MVEKTQSNQLDRIINIVKEIKGLVINVSAGRGSCQLRCKYCFLDKDSADTTVTSYDDLVAFKNLVDPYQKHANIQIFGTEPLLHPEVIEWTRKLWPDRQITITTNAMALDEKMMDFLIRNNVGIQILSFDGPYQNENRRTIGGMPTYDQVVRQIELIPPHARKNLTLRQTVMPGQKLVPIYEEGLKYNVGSITPIHDIETSYFKTEEVLESIIDLAEFFEFKMPPTRLYEETIRKIITGKSNGNFCNVLMGQLALNPGGNVSQCHHGLPYQTLFNVHKPDQMFESEFQTLVDQKQRINSITDSEYCQNCQAKQICPQPGQCTQQFYTVTGDLQQPSESYCNVQNAMYQGFQYWQSGQNIVEVEA